MGETIRVRLTLWYVAILALLLIVFAGIVTAAELRNDAIELDETLRSATLAVQDRLKAGAALPVASDRTAGPGHGLLGPGGPTQAGGASDRSVRSDRSDESIEALAGPEGTDGLLSLRLMGQSGRVIRSAGDRRLAQSLPVPQHWPRSSAWDTVRLPWGETVRVYRGTIQAPGGRQLRIEAAGANRDYRELARLLGAIAVAVPPTLVLAALMGLFLAGKALQPMEKITQTARELSAGDLSRRIALKGPRDEIKQLADTFDEMLARLEAAFRSQQSFVADASHELRTPLTILQSHADLALSDPAADLPQCIQTLELMRSEVRRLSRLVSGLLTLARADAGHLTVARTPVDLAALCEETVCQLRPLAGQRSLVYEGAPELVVEGDPDWLQQLLLNLVENAIHHTAPDGVIRLRGERESDRVRVEIRDDGCGIAPEHLPRLFDRFYRVEKARSRARGGAGLGLSIVRWIVDQHNGTIEMVSRPGSGTTVIVRLPSFAEDREA